MVFGYGILIFGSDYEFVDLVFPRREPVLPVIFVVVVVVVVFHANYEASKSFESFK